MGKAPDRRIRKTQQLIKKTLIELLKEKSIQEISVVELSDRADLNRGTFYLHYKDIFSLLEQMENEFFMELKNIMDSHPIQESNGSPLPLLEDLFRLLEKNASFCIVLLSSNGTVSFMKQLKLLLRETCFNHWSYLFHKEENALFEYYYNYMLGGCIGLIEIWLLNEERELPEKMALLTKNILEQGIDILK